MIIKGYRKEQTISRVITALLLLFIGFVSCQDDKEDFGFEGNYTSDGRFMILPVFHQNGMEISTRALITGYHLYEPEDGELIYAWAKRYTDQGDDSLIQGEFRRSGGKWYSSVEVKGGKKYRMFAFNPGGITTNRPTFAGSNGTYTLSLSSPIDIVTQGDPTISIAAARSYYQNSAYTNPTPSPGNFDLGEISNDLNQDRVLLAMNHLYSKANMVFTLDTVYSKLRTIVITEIKIVSAQGRSSSMNLTFGNNPRPTWGDYTNDSLEVSLPIPGDSIVLDKTTTTEWDGSTFSRYLYSDTCSFCYLPKPSLPVKLAVKYNVYTGDIDQDPLTAENYKDRLARKGQTATNGKIMPSGTPQAGSRYTIKIGVMPSYLYQLTDDDLDIRLNIE